MSDCGRVCSPKLLGVEENDGAPIRDGFSKRMARVDLALSQLQKQQCSFKKNVSESYPVKDCLFPKSWVVD
jgi:hypothetical protein